MGSGCPWSWWLVEGWVLFWWQVFVSFLHICFNLIFEPGVGWGRIFCRSHRAKAYVWDQNHANVERKITLSLNTVRDCSGIPNCQWLWTWPHHMMQNLCIPSPSGRSRPGLVMVTVSVVRGLGDQEDTVRCGPDTGVILVIQTLL